MQMLRQGQILQAITRTGKAKFWSAGVFQDEDNVVIIKRWWQDEGAAQTSTPVIIKGKNLGKANETSPSQQALYKLDSLYNKQSDKGYSLDGSTDHIPTKPMLAHSYSKRAHNIVFPCFVQPKLDGFRMLMDGTSAWTRGAKQHVIECIQHLMFDTGGMILDGELLLPGNVPLQQTSRAAKKFRADASPTLQYWVYDLISDDDFEVRLETLRKHLTTHKVTNVFRVPTVEVHNETELRKWHSKFLEQGYEGTIIRNKLGGYDVGNRSPNLQKKKDFLDSEFLVQDIIEGEGSFLGKAIVVCLTSEGRTFNVSLKGTMQYRGEVYTQRDLYIGQFLTVKYQTLSEDGIPIFPVGITFRDKGEF